MQRLALALFTSACAALSCAGEWEPFYARVVRTTRAVNADGSPGKITQKEETFLRDAAGSLRREVRDLDGGRAVEPPTFVVLQDVPGGKVYHLDLRTRKAELQRGLAPVAEQLYRESLSSRASREEYHGVPCVVRKTVFLEDGKPVSGGKACTAVGYGVVIHERSPLPAGMMRKGVSGVWETDLIEFRRNSPPASELMSVPPTFAVTEVTVPAVERCPTCRR